MTARGNKDPAIVRCGVLSIQVCVPKHWTDEQILNFANWRNPCGTTNGWVIRRQGDPDLLGDDERVRCSADEEFVHVMLDA